MHLPGFHPSGGGEGGRGGGGKERGEEREEAGATPPLPRFFCPVRLASLFNRQSVVQE